KKKKKKEKKYMKWLLIFCILDLITGILKSLKLGQKFKLKKLLLGLIDKYIYIVLLITSKYLDEFYNIDIFNYMLCFCILYEISSNIENLSKINGNFNEIIKKVKEKIDGKNE
ncbi:MAG: phage holin family protein, partial [Candidatus Gastranaerophilales bacterium]|nr:phage holin family protein [Candidatus Gastranaerophilales bacterium]